MALVVKMYGNGTQRRSNVAKGELVGGMPIQLSIKMLLATKSCASVLVELIHNVDEEAYEYEVTAAVLGVLCLDVNIILEMICMGWFEEKLGEWRKSFKPVLNRASRSNIFGTFKSEKVTQLRKLLNLSIRRKTDANLEVERRNRAMWATPKLWPMHSAEDWHQHGSPKKRYMQRFMQIAIQAWREVLMPSIVRSDLKTAQDFWDNRVMYVGSGSSTIAKQKKKELLEMDERIGTGDRMNKKVVVETLPSTFLQDVIDRNMPTNRASYFVKPEPGLKARALYSTFDEESFVAAYASQFQESSMSKLPGMMIRQTPHDVIRWMAESESKFGVASSRNEYWVSTDYSDYNSEHTTQELMAVQLAAWAVWDDARQMAKTQALSDKSRAAMWIARSYLESWVCWGLREINSGEWIIQGDDNAGSGKTGMLNAARGTELVFSAMSNNGGCPLRKQKTWSLILNGMYSGSRDTARNNSMIHWVDIQLAKEMLRDVECGFDPLFYCLCGDDEDIKFRNEVEACIYTKHLPMAGHKINPIKQMAGKNNHEFLQMMWQPNVRVEKSLNALLATIASGNWYTQLGLWIQTAIESCVANFWECHCRGMRLSWARRLCCEYLDRLMTLPPEVCKGTEYEESGKRLEWWKFRGDRHLAPLFKQQGVEVVRMPRYESRPDVRGSWPSLGSVDYVQKQKSLLRKLPKDYSKEFIEATQMDTVGAILKTWRQKDAKRWCARFWPERGSDKYDIEVEPQSEKCEEKIDEIGRFWIDTPREKRVVSEEMVYGRMGLSMFLGRKLGGLKNLGKYVSPEQWSKACNVAENTFELNTDGHKLQTNVKACLSYWKVPKMEYHGVVRSTMTNEIEYIFMANASGKSHFTRVSKMADDLDELWCDLYGAFRENFDAVMPTSSFTNVTGVATDIMVQCMKSTGVLLGQLQPAIIQRTRNEYRVRGNNYYYDPGAKIREERMRRRGWTEDKIVRRLERARRLYDEAEELGWTKLDGLNQVEEICEAVERRRKREVQMQMQGGCAMEAYKFVFDRTELVTRQLKIESERENIEIVSK